MGDVRRAWFGPRHAILLSAFWVSAAAACAFDPPPIEVQDAGLEADAAGAPDAMLEPPDAALKDANDFERDAGVPDAEEPPFAVPFLPDGQQSPGEGDLALQGDLLVDTSTSVGFPAPPAGVVFEFVGSSTLARAVLRVRNLEIPAGTTLRVQGSHPLIVVAETILIEGLLDASAHGPDAGPGGGSELDPGPGAGGPGGSGMGRSDSGGGGAGGGVPGAAGGAASDGAVPGGAPGEVHLAGDVDRWPNLRGGSAGGRSGPGDCPMAPLGGAGGGAVVLYAAQSLVITSSGAVDVSGGGAQIAGDCGANGAAGAGGGSGGVAFLVARSVTMTGTIAANGGAGGGGSGEGTGPGNAGEDGLLGLDAARGGARRDARGQRGGDGGARSPPEPGDADLSTMNPTRGNGGGGGGASGRIHLRYRRLFEVEGSTSPGFTYERR